MFGTLAELDALIADLHARGMRLVMDLVVNHTSDEHPWFVESRASKDSPKRDWYWWRETPNNWTSAFSGSGVGARRGDRRALPAPVLAQAARPQLGEPRGPAGRLRDDELVAGPRGRRLPDGRHQHDLQGPGAARRRRRRGGWRRRAASTTSAARASTSSCRRCTARSSRAATRCSTSGRCRASRSRRRGCSPTRRATSSTWSSSSSTSTSTSAAASGTRSRSTCATSSARSGAGRRGSRRAGWNSLYWNNHDQPRIVSRWGDDGEHRVRSAKLLGTLLHLHRGTPYVYQGEELGMTNVAVRLDRGRSATSSRSTTTPRRSRTGRTPTAVLASMRPMSRDNARTPMQWDDSRARRLHDRRAVDRGQPQPRRDQRGGGGRRPRLGLPPLPAG